ncbi:MAG: hypothetical protein COB45_02630 [Gammaproteobacteria bacterium]|nr:MAG: hypothetical protein COB45_02630 [Gammaproteobacteria bacterium]
MSRVKQKLKVFLTIDTEVWEFYQDIQKNVSSGLWGITSDGEYGLNFQLETFQKYNLKATFFVEPFFSYHSGKEILKTAVNNIQLLNQEVGLHIHTEWLSGVDELPFDLDGLHRNIGDFDLSSQVVLIDHARNILFNHADSDVCCFRAGNYGADNNTLNALYKLGITFDTSYNEPYLNAPCNIITNEIFTSPKLINNTIEIPVSNFNDYPNHKRHLQLSACSFSEIKDVLLSNWQAEQFSCVIVLHSFEWIKRNKKNNTHSLDKICLKRFLKLCQYLSDNMDKFETLHFKDIDKEEIATLKSPTHTAKSKPLSTLMRFTEQFLRRP